MGAVENTPGVQGSKVLEEISNKMIHNNERLIKLCQNLSNLLDRFNGPSLEGGETKQVVDDEGIIYKLNKNNSEASSCISYLEDKVNDLNKII